MTARNLQHRPVNLPEDIFSNANAKEIKIIKDSFSLGGLLQKGDFTSQTNFRARFSIPLNMSDLCNGFG